MTWNLPYKPSKTLMSQIIDHHSPLGQSMSTPSDVSVGTPYANDVASPSNALSPLSSALRKKRPVERAQLFFEGKYQQLLASMSTEEQVYEYVPSGRVILTLAQNYVHLAIPVLVILVQDC